MQTPFDETIDKTLKGPFSFPFETDNSGVYLIEITASAKNKKQNVYPSWAWSLPLPVRSVPGHDDDDLYIRLDERIFSKKTLNSPVAWSGASLSNSEKTVIFVIFLEKGSRIITFFPEETPTLKRICCKMLDTPDKFSFLPKENNPPKQKERAAWITVALVDFPVVRLQVNGKVEKRKKWLFFTEDDDIKVTLDGNVQLNPYPKSHKEWVFCARSLAGNVSFTKNVNWKPDIHYLEIDADWTPTLEQISFETIRKFKSLPDRNYNRFDREIEEATFFWNNFYRKQVSPPPNLLDPNLVKAVIYRESRLGYFPNAEIIDVMQVWDEANPAKGTLLGNNPESELINPNTVDFIHLHYPRTAPIPKVEYPKDSIFWGVRWLYHKAQRLTNLDGPYQREWLDWEQAIRNYNANEKIVEAYLREVYSVYENGTDLESNILWER